MFMALTEEQKQLLQGATFLKRPRIYDRASSLEDVQRFGSLVCSWASVQHAAADAYGSRDSLAPHGAARLPSASLPASGKAHKVSKQVKSMNGRTFTSQFRGVHQTFPTKRWEAQFRRHGKPTSLGCFDQEEEAARAYDRMMVWCHLHKELSCKHGITNYEMKEYEVDYDWLMKISQDELIEKLRSSGRRQAATRQLRNKQHTTFGMPVQNTEDQVLHRTLWAPAHEADASPSARNGDTPADVPGDFDMSALSAGAQLDLQMGRRTEQTGLAA